MAKNVYDEDFKRSIVSLYQNGKTQTQLSKDYGISLSAINKWVKQYSEIKTEDGDVFTAKQIKELQKRNAQLEEENQILKKGDCHLHATLKQRLNAIFTLRNQHNIKLLCKVFNVNRSTYYKYISNYVPPRIEENQMISRIILKIHGDYDKRLGAYKITHILERDYGIKVSVGRVYRLIQKLNLPTMSTSKPFIKASKENCKDTKLCNHLKQEFNPPEPNMVWASDFTYIKVNGIWVYLCIIMDLFSRKIISWNISNKADSNLIMSTFNDAYNKRNCPTGLMFHSDRGTQYTAAPFRKLLDKFNVVQSFSKKGYPFDNACCESFFKYLKKEECNRKNYHSIGELKLSLFEYIEGFYNLKRPHYSLGLMTPNERELAFYEH